MTIQANTSGTRQIEVTPEHLKTIKQYSLLDNLVDSSGIINEETVEKLRLNIRSLLDTEAGRQDQSLLDLALDVVYHKNMKAFALARLIESNSQQPIEDQE